MRLKKQRSLAEVLMDILILVEVQGDPPSEAAHKELLDKIDELVRELSALVLDPTHGPASNALKNLRKAKETGDFQDVSAAASQMQVALGNLTRINRQMRDVQNQAVKAAKNVPRQGGADDDDATSFSPRHPAVRARSEDEPTAVTSQPRPESSSDEPRRPAAVVQKRLSASSGKAKEQHVSMPLNAPDDEEDAAKRKTQSRIRPPVGRQSDADDPEDKKAKSFEKLKQANLERKTRRLVR